MNKKITISVLSILAIIIIAGSFLFGGNKITAQNFQLDDQAATILSIKQVMPAVVSIIVYDKGTVALLDLGSNQQTIKTEKIQKGSGTGFLISADGLILTNKHVINVGSDTAEYRVILNSGKQYYAQLIGKDPVNDLAVLKIFDKNLPFVTIGDSNSLQIGTTVIAIGNALGRYQNSATKGIVSGLGRSLNVSEQTGNSETLDNIIQTDANINPGNSGGPLIDLAGKVVGINTAIDTAGDAVGFAIPINDARPVVKSIKEVGRIVRPRLGVSYIMITPEIAQDKGLPMDHGALITPKEEGGVAVLPDLPAAKAGLMENDIVYEINKIKIKGQDTLLSIVQRYKVGDKIGLKVRRGDQIMVLVAKLDEFK